MKKILVTGSKGFIGRALVSRLSGMGFPVTGFDVDEGDIADEHSLERLESENISYVFHLAGKTFVPESWSDPVGFYRTNVLGTANILEFCRRTGAGLTYISSYLYGSPEYLPIDEKHPLKTYNPYSHTKLVAEEICRYYRDQFNLGITILRPFNVYGPGQSKRFLIPEMIGKMMDPAVEQIEVMDIRPRRDFVFIDDFVEALVLSMDGPRGTYNVGSGYSVGIEDILLEIKKITGKDKPIRDKKSERPNEIFDLFADVSQVSRELKWKPITGIHEGIAKCIGMYDHHN